MEGKIARLYDVFVDWEGRLARELPGLMKRLREADAKRVLDVGCGTGRHVQALVAEGFDAHGSDASESMLDRARELVGAERIHCWRAGDPPPPDLEAGSFDAVIALGNLWPLIVEDADVEGTLDAFRRLLRPGGLVLLGLKALGTRQETGNPYMPLLRREQDGRPVWFIRFVDFDVPQEGVCDFHMVVVAEDSDSRPEELLHLTHRMRVWKPDALTRTFTEAGFTDVKVSAKIGDPGAPPQTEDVFLHARS
jgi:SAM-dependent methyltransferase